MSKPVKNPKTPKPRDPNDKSARARLKQHYSGALIDPNPTRDSSQDSVLSRGQLRAMMNEMAKLAPKAAKGSASYKLYKLFQTKDDRLLAQALGILSRHLDPFTYYEVPNYALVSFVRTITAKSQFRIGLKMLGDGVLFGGDKYYYIKFQPDNPLAPIALLQQISKKYYAVASSLKSGDGPGCNFDQQASTVVGSPAGTQGFTTTSITPLTHDGKVVGGANIGLHPPANKKDFVAIASDGAQLAPKGVAGFTGNYAGMYSCKSGDNFRFTGIADNIADWNMNCLFLLSDGTYTWGTVNSGLATRNPTLNVSAPANAVAGVPIVAYTNPAIPGIELVLSSISFQITASSWAWVMQYGDYAQDLLDKMLNWTVNGYSFVITPENAAAFKSGYTQIVRVPNRSHYTAARSPDEFWDLLRSTQGLEQRGASMAGSAEDGEGVSGIIPYGNENTRLWTRDDAPEPYEVTIFGFRQPSVPVGATFQDTTSELTVNYCYQYQPAKYSDQNIADYHESNPQAEALAQSVLVRLKWFKCNPSHPIFQKAAGIFNNAKSKLLAYNAEHPEVAPKVLEALSAIGMSLMA